MGTLGNLNHERFAQDAHKRIWSGQKRAEALTAAYLATVYEGDNPDSPSVQDNARRLANQKPVKDRLAELADYSSKLAGIDASWAMLELARRVKDFNLDDYLSPPGFGGRFFTIDEATRDQLGKLSELTIDEEIIEAGEDTMRKVRKIKLKPYDAAAIIGLMARIGGWEAPKKIAPTDADGNTLTLESLVTASMKPKEPAKQAA
jgi:hypothetical protein